MTRCLQRSRAYASPGPGIDASMRRHADEPVLALLRLVHFRIALFVAVRGRAGAAIWGGSTLVPSRIIKPLLAQRQLTPSKIRRASRPRNSSSVVASVPTRASGQCRQSRGRPGCRRSPLPYHVRQAEALLNDIHAWRPHQANRRTAVPFAPWGSTAAPPQPAPTTALRPRSRPETDRGRFIVLVDELGVGERGLLHGCSAEIEGVVVPPRHADRDWPTFLVTRISPATSTAR